MPKTLDRILAFEEATFGRIISWKGLKYMASAAVTGVVIDVAVRKVSDKRNKEADDKAYAALKQRQAANTTSAEGLDQFTPDPTQLSDTSEGLNTEEVTSDR